MCFFTVFLKNRNISSKIKRSKVTDYAALSDVIFGFISLDACADPQGFQRWSNFNKVFLFCFSLMKGGKEK